ncbi:GntR family transcriptional regulator [Stappia sp. 28M-7]|uniref:GntR family transcriptional regulator n=1 Tax=Stappia sp. 28M-7 TaxID=2762596 RepID=UPI00163CE531|nr:GntR family transcriptional regulator [Stappia sp. 28M-7]MBC2858477.1 GntR family transcriptional regulator [Stappia sp. 28M-7]
MSTEKSSSPRNRSHIEPEEFAQRLLQLFHNDSYQLGQKVSERKLATQLGVSRTPVRAALFHLLESGNISRDEGQKWILAKLPDPVEKLLSDDDSDDLDMLICNDWREGKLSNSFTETDLIKRYGVSKADLNRSLIALVRDGIVERSSGYGWHFAALLDSEERRLQSYDFRLAIEPAGMRLDSFQPNASRLARQRSLHEELLAGKMETTSARALFEVNSDFHLMVAEFSANEFIIQAVKQQNKLRRISEYATTTNPARVRQSCEEHMMIVEALEQGEFLWASSLMERHLQIVRRSVLQRLMQQR